LAGIQTVQIEISTGTDISQSYWTGSAWTRPRRLKPGSPPRPPIPGTIRFRPSLWFSDTLYYLRLQITDKAGNTFTSQTSTFTYDTTGPTVFISTPTNGAYYSSIQVSTSNFSGTTTDNGTNPTGLSTVTVTLADITGGPDHALSNVPARKYAGQLDVCVHRLLHETRINIS